MARYLAAFHPGGSWSSRKTYTDLVSFIFECIPLFEADVKCDRSETWPIASNHTVESWLGHYKKETVHFTRRIQQYKSLGIDGSLKTKAEREAEEETRRREAAPTASTSQP